MERDYIFVYGLFRDQAKNLLGAIEHLGKATVDGKIYKVNEFYPGFIRGKEGKVCGDVYIFNRENLPQLDEYEGDEYDRKRIMTSLDIECWVYEYKYDVSEFELIKLGDWMLR